MAKKKLEPDKKDKIGKKVIVKKKKKKKVVKKTAPKVKSQTEKKSVNRGFSNLTYNRVRKTLWTNFKQDFSSYKEFISSQKDEFGNKIAGTSIPSRVFAECKSQDCTDKDVINIYLQLNQSIDSEKPELPSFWYGVQNDGEIIGHHYWELLTENWFSVFPDNLWVYSPMLLAEPDSFLGVNGEDRCVDEKGEIVPFKDGSSKECSQGGNYIEGYRNRFRPFIESCNLIQQITGDKNDYIAYWRFYGTDENPLEAYWSEERKRWEVELITCDQYGERHYYNYTPEPEGGVFDIIKPDETNKQKSKEKTEEEKIDQEQESEKTSEELKIVQEKIKLEQEEQKTLKQREETAKAEAERLKLEQEKNKQTKKDIDYYLSKGFSIDQIMKILGL